MALIDKDTLLEEIDRLQNTIKATSIDHRISKEQAEAYKVCVKLRSFIEDSIEIKEVNLEKELENLIEKEKAFITDNREVKYYNGDSFNHIYELEFIAKHFFELGIKTQKGE